MRNPSFSTSELVNLAKQITVASIMTSEDRLICVNTETTVGKALKVATQGPFDQLPVRNDGGKIVGLVWTTELKAQALQDHVSVMLKDLESLPPLPCEASLNKALSSLNDSPAKLVAYQDKIVGLVHLSDFNKHPARTYFYLYLSAMEIGLAQLIRAHFPDDSWINLLSEGTQVQILGKIEVERRRNNELDPIEYVDLSDLVRVISKCKGQRLWHDLWFNSQAEWNKYTGGLVELRHSVMHPVRTLVSGASSLSTLAKREKKLRSIVARIDNALRGGEISGEDIRLNKNSN